jgi:hypothetical protein
MVRKGSNGLPIDMNGRGVVSSKTKVRLVRDGCTMGAEERTKSSEEWPVAIWKARLAAWSWLLDAGDRAGDEDLRPGRLLSPLYIFKASVLDMAASAASWSLPMLPREALESSLCSLERELWTTTPFFSFSKWLAMAFLRTLVMVFLFLKSAGLLPVMKSKLPPLLSLAGLEGLRFRAAERRSS